MNTFPFAPLFAIAYNLCPIGLRDRFVQAFTQKAESPNWPETSVKFDDTEIEFSYTAGNLPKVSVYVESPTPIWEWSYSPAAAKVYMFHPGSNSIREVNGGTYMVLVGDNGATKVYHPAVGPRLVNGEMENEIVSRFAKESGL